MKLVAFLCIGLLLIGCTQKGRISTNPYFPYFYPYDTIPRIYLFRDVAHGLDEQYQRIYGLEDSFGKHIIVEIYAADGRIIEAMNYNLDSLDVMDHMVVDRNQRKTKADLLRNKLIPERKESEAYFSSRFPGFLDSTIIVKEVKRRVINGEITHKVLDEEAPSIRMDDKIKLTNFNPITRKETSIEGMAVNYFAKGYGLVEWHSVNKKSHYRLEKVMKQEEWIKIMTR